MKKNILITGLPKSGKTTLLKSLIAKYNNKSGFVTNEIRENETRVGFEIESHTGEKGLLAHTQIGTNIRVGKYGVDISSLESISRNLLKFNTNDILYIDEIGEMEIFSESFKNLTLKYLDSENSCIATISKVYENDFTKSIKERNDVMIFEISEETRTEKEKEIITYLQSLNKIMEKENIEKILKEALLRSYAIHESIGKSGEEMVQKNQFGEFALRGDIEAEKSIIQYLQSINFPIKIISEEHGITVIGGKQEYLGVLDGIDGSAVYKSNRGSGRYGTMFAIFSNVDPKYNEYISCGIMEHSSGNAYIATKEKGAFIHKKDSVYPIQTNPCTLFDINTNIYIDEYWDINKETFSEKLIGYNTHCLHASSAHYMEVAEGKASFALECTRKGNLEIAVAYGLIHEAGGLMIDISGDDLGEKYYLKFGQDKHIPIITGANKEIVGALMDYIKK